MFDQLSEICSNTHQLQVNRPRQLKIMVVLIFSRKKLITNPYKIMLLLFVYWNLFHLSIYYFFSVLHRLYADIIFNPCLTFYRYISNTIYRCTLNLLIKLYLLLFSCFKKPLHYTLAQICLVPEAKLFGPWSLLSLLHSTKNRSCIYMYMYLKKCDGVIPFIPSFVSNLKYFYH